MLPYLGWMAFACVLNCTASKGRSPDSLTGKGNTNTVADMAYIMIDIEADSPIPGDYSMVCFGAIVVEPSLDRTFYGRLKPISDKWIADALQVSNFSRAETLTFADSEFALGQDHERAIDEYTRAIQLQATYLKAIFG